MKNNINAFHFFITFAFGVTLIISCENTSSDVDTNAILKKDGYIKGTVQTTRENGNPISYDFYFPFRVAPTIYNPIMGGFINFSRYESTEGVSGSGNRAFIEFQLTDSLPDLAFVLIQNQVELSPDTLFFHYLAGYKETATEMKMTEYSFDDNANIIKGTFTMTTTSTYTGNPATVNGSFESSVTKYDLPSDE